MPPNPERRTVILGAATDIVVALPAGTTSNYFRNRLALLEATAAHVVDLHWQHVEAFSPLCLRR